MPLISTLLLAGAACFQPISNIDVSANFDSLCIDSGHSKPSYDNLIVRQTKDKTCGAASIATLANMLGIANLTEEDVLAVLGTTDLISVAQLVEAAQKFNLPLKPFSTSLAALKTLPLPVIVALKPAHNMILHFVVLLEVGNESVMYADPQFGRVVAPLNAFLDKLTVRKHDPKRPAVVIVPQLSMKPVNCCRLFGALNPPVLSLISGTCESRDIIDWLGDSVSLYPPA
jgi:uncharacterized protein